MRHRVYGKHLGRNKDQRKNLFRGLVHSLISSGTIQTSETKAKAIKGLVDKIINEQIKKGILPKIGNRNSGYTSIVKIGTRAGDQATIVKMSLIDADKLKPVKKEAEVKKVEPVKKAPAKRKVAKNEH